MVDYVIRQFAMDDKDRVQAFFDGLGGEARVLFNRNSGNENAAMGFFDGTDVNVIRWMMLDNDEMIGYVFLCDIDKKIPWLGIAVADDYKGRHLGRKLMTHAKNYAVEKEMGGILLTTNVVNLRGQGLYSRMGYEHLGMHTTGELLYLLRF